MTKPYKIGIAPINWCNDDDTRLGAHYSFEQCIEEMAQTGYQGCEVGHKFPRDVQVLKSHLQPLGMEVSSAWFSALFTMEGEFENTLSRFLDHLSFLNSMGAKFITVAECGQAIHNMPQPMYGEGVSMNERQWNALIQGLHVLGRLCHDYGMKLVYHHHLGTVVEIREQIARLMDSTCPSLLGLLLDTGHAHASGMCPVDLIKQYGSRIEYIHLKDVRQSVLEQANNSSWSFMQAVKSGAFTVPGDGDIDFKAVFNALKGNDYRGWLIVEAEQDPDIANPKHYAKKARQFIQESLGV